MKVMMYSMGLTRIGEAMRQSKSILRIPVANDRLNQGEPCDAVYRSFSHQDCTDANGLL